MEAALGVSYPTVKGHLASIKEKLNLTRLGPRPPAPPGDASQDGPGSEKGRAPEGPTGVPPEAQGPAGGLTAEEVLDGLEQGRISYKEAVRLLRGTR